MTAKRFTVKDDVVLDVACTNIFDNGEFIGTVPLFDAEKFVDLLNELHEDNQLLHKMNAEAIDFMYDNFDLNIMFTDRELNNICNEIGWELSEKGIKIAQLEKENEQLREELKELKIDNKAKDDAIDGLQSMMAHYNLEDLE